MKFRVLAEGAAVLQQHRDFVIIYKELLYRA
jgi:hypothetical protein